MATLRVWLTKLQIASREPWAADADSPSCASCAAPFDLMSRRHHCRRCGVVVCERCSPRRQAMPEYAYMEPVRVCNACYGERGPVLPESARAGRAAAKAEEHKRGVRAEAEAATARARAERDGDAEARKAKLREALLKKS